MPLTARTPSRHLVDLVGTLGGTWHGHTAMCRCPVHADRTPSLSLRQGDRGILVTCFAGCAPAAILRALDGIPLTGPHQAPAQPAIRSPNVLALWNAAVPVTGSLAQRYLARRGFDDMPADLRFHPRCPHGPRPATIFRPALLVAVRERHEVVAVQRIFMDPATAAYEAKVMLGRPGQGAWRGGGSGPVLAIAEGFETAHAFMLLHGVPCWAALGARRLDQVAIPDSVETLLIAGDNDAEGRRATGRAIARYAKPGRSVAPRVPAEAKDWALVWETGRRAGRA